MVKSNDEANKLNKDSKHTCSLCNKVTHNYQNLCTICATCVRKKSGPNASNFDKLLIQLVRNSKANLRSKLVKKLSESQNQGFKSKSMKIKEY